MATLRLRKRRVRKMIWGEHILYGILFLLALMTLSAVTSCSRKASTFETDTRGILETVKDTPAANGYGFLLLLAHKERREAIVGPALCSMPQMHLPARDHEVGEDRMRVSIAYE